MKYRETIKNILPEFLFNLLVNFYNFISRIIFFVLVRISPVLATKFWYKKTAQKRLDLKNPKDFNEKLQWLKLYWQHPLLTKCADKYEVREHIKECDCEEILNELYGVYEDVSEIDWDKLPNKFVLKTTNACGTNIICDDKSKLNKDEVFKKLNKWLKIDFGKRFGEIHYSKMKPRIICERYLETEAGFLPNDYKIYCFNGNPKVVLVCVEREISLKIIFLDLNWNRINIDKPSHKLHYKGEIPLKPRCFEGIIEYSEKISKPFPFVRIDFYDYKNKPLLGEMTFTPYGGVLSYHNEKSLKEMGGWIKLPEKYIPKR